MRQMQISIFSQPSFVASLGVKTINYHCTILRTGPWSQSMVHSQDLGYAADPSLRICGLVLSFWAL